MCGGLWVTAVNTGELRCTEPAGRECYVAATTIGELPLPEERRALLAARFAEGRALAAGLIARGLVKGFPDLGVLRVFQVWDTPRAPARARGTFYLLRAHGRPSITATVLNTLRELRVSAVDLSPAGATAAERRRAKAAMASARGLVVAGRIVRNGGRRTVAAFQLYERAYP